MAKEPEKVHVDLLEIDMRTGAHWLSPVQKNAGKGGALDQIRARNRKKYLDAKKAEHEKAWDESKHPRDPAGSPTGGQFTGDGGEGEGEGEAAHVRDVLDAGRQVAKELGFDPKLVSIGAPKSPDVDFVLNGKPYKAAGLAYTHEGPMKGHIKLFTEQIANAEIAKGVTAHEVEHQKFQTALDKYQKEAAAMMADPGPPPNPDSEHWWEKIGGKEAVMRPDGTLWPPYDEKYPNYQAMEKNFRTYTWDDFADADGVSGYSYEYWKAFKQRTVTFELAVHETLAEMGRIKYETGKFPDHYGERIIAYRGEDKPKPPQSVIDANAKRWRDLYRTVEEVYKGTA